MQSPLTPVFIHIPHDSTVIPPAELVDFVVSEEALLRELVRLTDWHTGDLMRKASIQKTLYAPKSRAWSSTWNVSPTIASSVARLSGWARPM